MPFQPHPRKIKKPSAKTLALRAQITAAIERIRALRRSYERRTAS